MSRLFAVVFAALFALGTNSVLAAEYMKREGQNKEMKKQETKKDEQHGQKKVDKKKGKDDKRPEAPN